MIRRISGAFVFANCSLSRMNGHSELPNGPVEPHILIIGAGITGLTLGQALKKANVSFTIFERDPDVHHRGSGWGLTIHWALQTFVSLLPQHLIDRLPETLVDPDASAKGENGNFLFFDLSTGETKYRVPPSKRLRMSRERLRALLLDGLDIHVRSSVFPFFSSREIQSSIWFSYERLDLTVANAVVQGAIIYRYLELQQRDDQLHRYDFRHRYPCDWLRWVKVYCALYSLHIIHEQHPTCSLTRRQYCLPYRSRPQDSRSRPILPSRG